jgi:signal transduction histidine kinase
MARRFKAGSQRGGRRFGKPLGVRRRKTPAEPKARESLNAPRRSRSTTAVRDTEVARLTRELTRVAEQQLATSEVLRLIGSSSGDLEPVFTSILASAARLCDAHNGAINRWDGDALQLIATHNMPQAFADVRKRSPYRPHQHSASGRMLASRAPVHIDDLSADRSYLEGNPPTVAAVDLVGVRTTLAVPMWKDDELIGSFSLGRSEVRPFTDRELEIVQSFAAQAVVAIENARLLSELHRRTDALSRTVAELQRERNNKLMNLEAMVASISHEVRQPLASIASNGGAAIRFLGREPPNLEEVRSALNRIVGESHRASQVFDNIRALFGKTERGHEPIDMSELIRGVLSGLQGELDEHQITAGLDLSADLPTITGHRGQLQEVLVNLIRNAIEAMDTDMDADKHADNDSRRALQVSSQLHGTNKVIVAVEDSGPGIDPKHSASIFDAFMTTKANGMGLGLALSRMIAERHGGQLSVSPAQPRGSIFRLVLPIGRASSDANT